MRSVLTMTAAGGCLAASTWSTRRHIVDGARGRVVEHGSKRFSCCDTLRAGMFLVADADTRFLNRFRDHSLGRRVSSRP
jgi:hypothetical protein